VDVGAIEIVLPKFVRKELDGYLECGLLCRGFARLRCSETCKQTRLVAFSCKGRGFCPSCLGRKMCATAAHLMDDVMPRAVPLRQWVLTTPFAWRKRLAYDGALWSALTRVFTKRVSRLYGKHGGAVIALQRTSSDMKLNPHVHAVFLDGHYVVQKDELDFETRSRLSTTDVASSSVGSRRRRLHQSSIPCATRESSRRRASCRRASLPSLPSRCRSIPRRTTSPLVVAPTDRGPSSCAGPSAWTCCNVPSERAKGTFTGEGSVQGARKSQLRGAKLACVCSPWSLSPRASPATSARSVSPPALPSPSPREVLPIGKVGSSGEPPSATRLLRRATGRARGPVFLSTDNGAKVVSKCRRPNTPSSVHIHPNALKPPPSVQSSPGETALIFLRSHHTTLMFIKKLGRSRRPYKAVCSVSLTSVPCHVGRSSDGRRWGPGGLHREPGRAICARAVIASKGPNLFGSRTPQWARLVASVAGARLVFSLEPSIVARNAP